MIDHARSSNEWSSCAQASEAGVVVVSSSLEVLYANERGRRLLCDPCVLSAVLQEGPSWRDLFQRLFDECERSSGDLEGERGHARRMMAVAGGSLLVRAARLAGCRQHDPWRLIVLLTPSRGRRAVPPTASRRRFLRPS